LPEGCLLRGLGCGTVLALALLPLVFAEAAAAAVLALALLPLVFAEAAAAAVLALVLPLVVCADAAPTTVLAPALPPLVFAELRVPFVLPGVPLCLSLLAPRGSPCAAGRRWGRWRRR